MAYSIAGARRATNRLAHPRPWRCAGAIFRERQASGTALGGPASPMSQTPGGCMQRMFVRPLLAIGALAVAGCATKPADPVAVPRASTQRIESQGQNILLTTMPDAY